MVPQCRQAVQRLRSTLVTCCTYCYAERYVGRSLTTPSALSWERNSSTSGESYRTIPRLSTERTYVFKCWLEEKIENRAAWKSCAEGPRCHFSVHSGSGVDPTPETDIIDHTHELSDLDIDKRCIHPGLEIEEEIRIQHEVETFEQPVLPLVRSVDQEKEFANGQDAVDRSTTLAQQEIEASYWTNTEIQPVTSQSEQAEASARNNVNVEKNANCVVELLREGGPEVDHGELARPPENHEGIKYLHVLSVAEVREVLEKARAKDLKVLCVKDSCEWTDNIVIASGRSTRHLRGMADAIVYKVKQLSHNVGPNSYALVEGREAEQWMTVDLGNIIIHLFLEEARGYYNLEELWRKTRSPSVEN